MKNERLSVAAAALPAPPWPRQKPSAAGAAFEGDRAQEFSPESEVARCDREIREMWGQPPTQPAYLTTLGIEDWNREKRMIEAGERWGERNEEHTQF